MTIKISASLICANQLNFIRDVQALLCNQIDMFHLDIMDGNFVYNFALNLDVIKDLRNLTNIPFDAHLMVQKPSVYFDRLIDYGVDIIIFHVECGENIKENLEYLNSKNIKNGLALHVETPISEIEEYLPMLDYVLVMNTKTGFSRGKFSREIYQKLSQLYSSIKKDEYNIKIISDGSISLERIPKLYECGVDIIIAGTSALFNENGFSKNLRDIYSIPFGKIKKRTVSLTMESGKDKIRAAVLHDVNDLKIETIKIPKPKCGEVTVDVKSCGICGSDLERAYKKGMYSKNLVPGHEFSGIISQVNKGDEKLLNKRCVVFPLIPCRKCEYCLNGNFNLCINYNYLGSRTNGGFAEKVNVPKENLIFIPKNMSFDEAACLEPLAVAYHGISRVGSLIDKNVLILGLGSLGLLVGSVAKVLGAKLIYGIDRNNFKHKVAKKLGFNKCFLPKENINLENIDLIVDCAGASELLNDNISCLKKKAKILILANYNKDFVLNPKNMSTLLRGEIGIITSWNSNITKASIDDWKTSMNFIKDKKIDVSNIITHRFPLKKIQEVFDIIYNKKIKAIKVIINIVN